MPKGPNFKKLESIFRAYDIRGVYGKVLTEEVMERIGRAFSGLIEGDTVVLARDGRLSGEGLARAFADGVLSTGRNVTDIGMLPLGAGMFHAWRNGKTFAYVTASHLGSEWNGLKFFNSKGIGFMEEDLKKLEQGFFGESARESGRGELVTVKSQDVIAEYIEHLVSKIRPERGLKIALDTGHGAAGLVVRELFTRAGFDVYLTFEDVDGRFPSRSPDPMTDPLRVLKKRLEGRELGIAYDGDGDRMIVLDEKGERVTPEQVSYIMLSELLKEQPGPIVVNVETTRTIDMIAERFRRHIHRVRVGHNYLMKGAFEQGACFGMEPSGHYSVPSIFPFDDSLAISYYFACALSRRKESLSELAREIPSLPFERVSFDVPDERKFQVMDSVREDLRKRYPNINTMDGIRVDFENGWVLVRPSNTQPQIRLTVEARTGVDLRALKGEFSGILKKYIKP
jgi:phosphomannomutase